MKYLIYLNLVLFLILVETKSLAQIEEQENLIAKNSIYGTAGAIVWAGGAITGNYEHKFMIGNGLIKNYYAKGGYGKFYSLNNNRESVITVGVAAMTGQKSSHVELSANAITFGNEDDNARIQPGGSLAYRYQAPGTNLIFRAGAGWPDFTFISVGIGF